MVESRCMLPMQLAGRGPPHVAAHHHLARVSGQALCNRADGPLGVLVLVLHGLGDKAAAILFLRMSSVPRASCILGSGRYVYQWTKSMYVENMSQATTGTGTKSAPLTHPRSPDGHPALRLAQKATGPHGHPTAGSHYPAAEPAEAPTQPTQPTADHGRPRQQHLDQGHLGLRPHLLHVVEEASLLVLGPPLCV